MNLFYIDQNEEKEHRHGAGKRCRNDRGNKHLNREERNQIEPLQREGCSKEALEISTAAKR